MPYICGKCGVEMTVEEAISHPLQCVTEGKGVMSRDFFCSSVGWTLDKIMEKARKRWGPAGVRATDIPKLAAALDVVMAFADDCHEWNLETLKGKRERMVQEVDQILSLEGGQE